MLLKMKLRWHGNITFEVYLSETKRTYLSLNLNFIKLYTYYDSVTFTRQQIETFKSKTTRANKNLFNLKSNIIPGNLNYVRWIIFPNIPNTRLQVQNVQNTSSDFFNRFSLRNDHRINTKKNWLICFKGL